MLTREYAIEGVGHVTVWRGLFSSRAVIEAGPEKPIILGTYRRPTREQIQWLRRSRTTAELRKRAELIYFAEMFIEYDAALQWELADAS